MAKLSVKILFRFRLFLGDIRPIIHFSKNCKKLMLVSNNKIAKIYTRAKDEKEIFDAYKEGDE